MCKIKILNRLAIYFAFLVNTVYSLRKGFTWLYWITAALTLALAVLDIVEAVVSGKR